MATEKNDMKECVAGLAQSGVFGKGKFLRVTDKVGKNVGAQFASVLKFLTVVFEEESTIKEVSIVAKVQPAGVHERELQNSDTQFLTELTMYKDIIPFLGANEIGIFPKLLYGKATDGKTPDSDIVIFDDLEQYGYKPAENLFFDLSHIKLALRKLGEFHGYSYKMKKHRPDDLRTLGKQLRCKKFSPDFNEMFLPIYERGFNAAKGFNSHSTDTINKVHEKIKKLTPSGTWSSLATPAEPYAVIIHGDFNKNNLLFKYDKNGQVDGVQFLDLQVSLYSDPAVDITFFLYMNTSQTSRDEHWDEYLRTYWSGVISIEPEPGFTFEEFLDNFSRRALYGYLPSSFFLPMMMKTSDDDVPLEEFLQFTFDQRVEHMLKCAGEEGSRTIGQIVLDLFDRGYLEKYLHDFN